MSKLHITLAENMSRFGTKNLTESNKHALRYLAEQKDIKQVSGSKPDSVIVSAIQQAFKLPLEHKSPTGGTGGGVKYDYVLSYIAPTNRWSYFAPFTPGQSVPKYVNGILSSLTINFAKGTLIHKYQYSIGTPNFKKSTSPEIMFTTSNLYTHTKTYTFKKDVADVTRMFTELEKVMNIIITNGPQLDSKTTVKDNQIFQLQKSGYKTTNVSEKVG